MGLLINILVAVILFVVALIAAKIVETIVLKILNVSKINESLSKFDAENETEELKNINVIGSVAYAITFLLFLVPIFNVLGLVNLSKTVNEFTYAILAFVPNLIFAGIIIVVGLFVANLVKRIVKVALYKFKVNELVKKLTFDESKEVKLDVAKIVSVVVYVLILITFIAQSLEILGLGVLTSIFEFAIALLPAIFVSIIIIIATYILSNFLYGVISRTVKVKKVELLANIVRYVVLVIGLGLVLKQFGIEIILFNATYLILIASAAISLVIAFGIGGIEVARKILNEMYDNYKK